MKTFLLICFLYPLATLAHPGIGIVKNSKGILYYTDLQQVWKITGGQKTIAVPNVHTHELFIDAHNNLYGQHEYNSNDTTFYHYMWVLRSNGTLDTLVDARLAYQQVDFSLARDKWGNEYYTKQFLKRKDTAHIYIKTPDGKESIFARGNFKGVPWLHPLDDGSLLFVQHNHVYRANPDGTIKTVAQHIAAAKPSFSFSGNSPTVWGAWQDGAHNIYVAVFSDQVVKKISPDGTVSNYYQSTGAWAPNHGVFDADGQLWLLESSDKNEIRVTKALPTPLIMGMEKKMMYIVFGGMSLIIGLLVFLLKLGKR